MADEPDDVARATEAAVARAIASSESLVGVRDLGAEEKLEKAREAAEARMYQRLEVVRNLMSRPAGRMWLYDRLEACHIYHMSFVQGDPHATSFREGERNVGNLLLGDIMAAAPEHYATMIVENKR